MGDTIVGMLIFPLAGWGDGIWMVSLRMVAMNVIGCGEDIREFVIGCICLRERRGQCLCRKLGRELGRLRDLGCGGLYCDWMLGIGRCYVVILARDETNRKTSPFGCEGEYQPSKSSAVGLRPQRW